MAPIVQRSTLERLPQEVLEIIAEFCGDVASVLTSEQADMCTFTEVIVHPYLDSAASNTWRPAYMDLRSLSLVSKTFTNAAQRALFKVVVVRTTSALMRLVRTLLQCPEKRRYVLCFAAAIQDHVRRLPTRSITPRPLVLSEFLFHVNPLLSADAVRQLPDDSFFRRTASLLQDIFSAFSQNNLKFTPALIDSTEINLHTLEDQILTATIQLLPRLIATRFCFGKPIRHNFPSRWEPASQVVHDPPIYTTLLDNHYNIPLKSLSLDFGALLSLTNMKRYVPGYPTGLPPSIERLTLAGNKIDSQLSYHVFDLDIFGEWLHTNSNLRELRVLDGFDKLVSYLPHNVDGQVTQNNWNTILLRYKKTLEVLVMDWYSPFGHPPPEGRFGRKPILACLPQMEKLQYLRSPLHALGGHEWNDHLGIEEWIFVGLVPDKLPPRCTKIDLMVRNPAVGSRGRWDGIIKQWGIVEYWPSRQHFRVQTETFENL